MLRALLASTAPDWLGETATLAEDLVPLYARLATSGAAEGLALLPGATVEWGGVNAAALQLARARAAAFAAESVASSQTRIAKVVADWIAQGGTRADLERAARAVWDDRRAAVDAVTEVTRIYAEANRMAWQASGIVRAYRYVTVRDRRVCPQCEPLSGREAPIADPSLLPPRHGRCRCYITPVV